MNITQEKIDPLHAVVKVKLAPEDYQAQVDSALKDYSKKVNMPGFRPGKVPVGMIRKMYGKSILADELNKILNDSVHKYIRENNIEILGNPLPAVDEQVNIDWENQKEFEFTYDIGLAPAFELSLSKSEKVPFYSVRIDETLVGKYIEDLSRRYGKLINPEISEEKDWLTADLVEISESGEIIPGGLFKSSSIFTERISNGELRGKFTGLKPESTLELSGNDFSDGEDAAYFAQLLQTNADKLKATRLKVTLKNINRLTPAELNQDLFDKIYGPGAVNSPEEFRARVREELSRMFEGEKDVKFRNTVRKMLLGKLNLALPDTFLKRWIRAVNDKPVTEEQVEVEYPSYAEQLKWQLIENKLLKDNDIKIADTEVLEHVKQLVKSEYERMGRTDVEETELNGVAHSVLSKEDEARKIYSQLYDQRLLALYKDKLTLDVQEVSYEEFQKI
ncbi:MAG: trigger factor [Bacteroidia bacterium]|nr:trigger factor [Bacteroidia bacterium]